MALGDVVGGAGSRDPDLLRAPESTLDRTALGRLGRGISRAKAAVVEIVAYSDAWPAEFRRIAARLRAALGDRALRIDHIGSTAVPGLAAKDRIDVQVTVAELSDANPIPLAGFREHEGYGDHRPFGETGPEEDWRKRLFSPDGERQSNVHAREAGRANQRYALLFRDYLRAYPDNAAAYGLLKQQLARGLRSPADYAEVKDPACDLIYVAAQAWAAAMAWKPGPSDG